MNLPLSPDDGHAFLLAVGLGVLVGVMFGGIVMSVLQKLLMTLLKMTLLGAVVVIGLVLWNGYQASPRMRPTPTPPTYPESTTQPTLRPTHHKPDTSPAKGRWWKQ